jgi:hypothetical protein
VVGREFTRQAFAGFVLNATTVAEAEAALGPPMKQTAIQRLVGATSKGLPPGTPFTTTLLTYFFFPHGPGPLAQGHTGKAATLVFFNDRLMAFGIDSTLPEDANRPIDETRLSALHQCSSTRSDVISLLGQPNGEILHLLDAHPGAVDIIYSWQNVQANVTARRSLRIFFDRSGAMSNYTLVDDQSAANGLSPAAQSVAPPTLPPACPNVAARQHT